MKKLNVKDIENLDQLKGIMDIYNFVDADENFIDEGDFNWWQDLANQKQYLEDAGVDVSMMDFDDIGRRYDLETSKEKGE